MINSNLLDYVSFTLSGLSDGRFFSLIYFLQCVEIVPERFLAKYNLYVYVFIYIDTYIQLMCVCIEEIRFLPAKMRCDLFEFFFLTVGRRGLIHALKLKVCTLNCVEVLQ